MATATIQSLSTSGSLYSDGGTNVTAARDGTGTKAPLAQNDSRVGMRVQGGIYQAYETFLAFDLTPYAGGSSPSGTLTLYCIASDAGTAFTVTAALYDWSSGGVDTGDWRNASQLSALTTRASVTSAGIADASEFTLTDVAMSGLVLGAVNYFVVYSSRHASASTPTGDEYLTVYSYDATHPAKLNLTYTPAASSPVTPKFIGGGFF